MSKLKLGVIPDENPFRLTVEPSAEIHRDLIAYAEVLNRQRGQKTEPPQLVAPILARSMATDRAFAKARKTVQSPDLSGS